MSRKTVSDLMVDQVFWVSPQDSIADAYEIMESQHIRHIPVVVDDRQLVGLLSQRDLVRSVLYTEHDLALSLFREVMEKMKVDQVMTRSLITTEPDAGLAEAGNLLLENKVSALPVVEGSRLVGMLTESDFVKYVIVGEE